MIKRLIGVIAVRNGWAVQSFGFKNYLPLGKPEVMVENLDRWQLDEILVLSMDRTPLVLGPDFELLRKIGNLGLSTPLCYMGGVRNAADAIQLLKLGADRIGIESLFYTNIEEVKNIRDAIGKQAIIRGVSVFRDGDKICRKTLEKESLTLTSSELEASAQLFSELLVIDRENEGAALSFDQKLLLDLPKTLQIICFGGISSREQVKSLLSRENISAVAVANFLTYKELANLEFIDDSSRYEYRDIDYGEQTKGALEW